MGEQDVADQRGAFFCAEGPPARRAAPLSLCVGHGMRLRLAYALSLPCDVFPSCSATTRRQKSIEFCRPGLSFFIKSQLELLLTEI